MSDVKLQGFLYVFSSDKLFWCIILTCFHFQTLAEKAAWDFVAEIGETEKFELAVINPVYIVGPALSGGVSTSQEVRQVAEKGQTCRSCALFELDPKSD